MYVKAGKGHYVPAKAVSEQLSAIGVETELADFFEYTDLQGLEKLNQGVWRIMLRVPFFERHFIRKLDNASGGMKAAAALVALRRGRRIKKQLEEFHPDFIFATHPYPGTVLATLFRKWGIDIPVYYYATDVFDAPRSAACPDLRRFLIATEEGAEKVRNMGMPSSSVILCPFPLQSSVAGQPHLSKEEARRKIGLRTDMFTLQLNLGGEGLGSLNLLEDIISRSLPVQVVVIGGIHESMRARLDSIRESARNTKAVVEIRGFVDNVSEYLAASDVVAGRAGINTIVEAIYAHRPFLITELVYTVIASAEYVEKHHVGWNADGDREKQIGIIESLLAEPSALEELERNFAGAPIEYSARHLAELLVTDAAEARRGGVTSDSFIASALSLQPANKEAA